jgi:hypothetical protein
LEVSAVAVEHHNSLRQPADSLPNSPQGSAPWASWTATRRAFTWGTTSLCRWKVCILAKIQSTPSAHAHLQLLDQITPVLLTYNEEQNISRTLSQLAWAKDIVVVDSGSTDGTLAALAHFPNVRVFNCRFDTHGKQWRYATEETNIGTDWLLRLDANYQVSDALIAELARLDPNVAVSAYRVRFDYARLP